MTRRRVLTVRTRLTLWYTAVLVAILLLISALSYSLVRWSLLRDLDTSLLTVAQLIRDAGASIGDPAPGRETAWQGALGPDFSSAFFQLVDPRGAPGLRSAHLRDQVLPLSAKARANAARGVSTFETVALVGRTPVRLLTMPVTLNGDLGQLIQVGMSLQRIHQTLGRYLESLLFLVPVGVALATVGGAVIARGALAPVDGMSRSARRITAEDLSRRIPLRGTGDELDRLAETLNAMLARLEGTFAQIRRFAADAAHELRTPLTALKGGIEVALRVDRPADEYRRVLSSSLEEAERLIRLAEDLLLMSRSTSGSGAPRDRVDLESLLVDVLDTGARLGHATGVTIRLGQVTPASVLGDGEALRRAILNLVENAIKYTPAGGVVELSLSLDAGTAAVVVKDTGIGIAPQDLERIFEPFVRLDSARSRETGGTGLGLSIARSIVLSHGGTVDVVSAPGAGSRFTILLPLA